MISRLVRRLVSGQRPSIEDADSREPLDLRQHIIVLGWGPQTPTVVAELVDASEQHVGSAVVVMGEADEASMQAAIASRVASQQGRQVVSYSGRPTDGADLARLSPETARAIVILPAGAQPDASVLETLRALPHTGGQPRSYQVVTALRDPGNTRSVRAAAGGQLQLVMIDDLVARVVAHSCLQPGMSLVFEELLTYAGNEVYVAPEPKLAGLTFGEALFCYERSTPIGLLRADGRTLVCPAFDSRIEPGDQLMAISANQNAIAASIARDVVIDEVAINPMRPGPGSPQRILVLGWNRRATLLLQHIDASVVAGSTLTLVHGAAADAEACRHALDGMTRVTPSLELISAVEPELLDRLAGLSYDRIIVLGPSEEDRALEAATTTMAVAQRLRDSSWRADRPFAIVAETGDHPGLRARQWTTTDELVAIDRLVALMVVQLTGSTARAAVFRDLLDADGAAFVFAPAEAYVTRGRAVSFYTVLESARRRGEIAVGYRLRRAQVLEPHRRVVLNPEKSDVVTYEDGDQILVLRNNDTAAIARESA